MIYKEIKKSYVLAKEYVTKCCITVNQNNKTITAFTEHEGKNRVTDWGGTSSAIAMFSQIGLPSNPKDQKKIKSSLIWLLNDQGADGSWEAAEMQCCEATSAVLFDLVSANSISIKAKDLAIKYITSCYQSNVGAFISQPDIDQSPHVYTTFLAIRALYLCKAAWFDDSIKKKTINWINEMKTPDGNWGESSTSLNGDVAHTVFALLILYYCGLRTCDIKKNYRKNIKWLRNQITDISTSQNAFSYEAIEVYSPNYNDQFGERANILKSYHFNTALLCNLFLTLKLIDVSKRLISHLISLRKERLGWGLNTENKIFVWATQQAIDCMFRFEQIVFFNKNQLIGNIRCVIYTIPFFKTKFFCGLIVLFLFSIIIWLESKGWKNESKGWDILLGFIFMIIPWIIKKED